MSGRQIITISEGLQKEILKESRDPTPNKGDLITVHCTGSVSGSTPKKFWSTKDPGQKPFSFEVGLGKVIQGWDEGCLTMRRGEIAVLYIASDKGYGKSGFPAWGIPPNADLQFEIEILSTTA